MGLHQNRNGLFNMCDNGLVQLSHCPSFDCRPIAYVDKHASGANNGTTPEDAYTDIQTAIDNDPKKEILIQGYGESDCYPAGIVLADCVYLHGVDSVWIDCEDSNYAVRGNEVVNGTVVHEWTTQIDGINVKNSPSAILYILGNIYNCEVKNITDSSYHNGGFYSCYGVIENCSVHTGGSIDDRYRYYGFFECAAAFKNCHVYDIMGACVGFERYLSADNCSCKRIGILYSHLLDRRVASLGFSNGGLVGRDLIIIDCVVEDCEYGFNFGSFGCTTSATNCTTTRGYIGVSVCGDTTLLDVSSTAMLRYGFKVTQDYGDMLFINCSASSQSCGYYLNNTVAIPEFINCNDGGCLEPDSWDCGNGRCASV